MTTEFNKEDLVFPFDTLQDKMKDIEKIYLEKNRGNIILL